MSPSSPQLTPEQASKLLKANYVAIAKKVGDGKPLSAHELALVKASAGEAGPEPVALPAFAPNQSALAAIFGVSRQLIGYHSKRPGNPGHTPDGRYPVEPWREYLQAFGRLPIDDAVAGGRPRYQHLDYGDGCYAAIDAVAETILPALNASGVKLSAKAKDRLAFFVWSILARAIDQRGMGFEFESYFESDPDTGEVFYPEAIQEIAARLNQKKATTI